MAKENKDLRVTELDFERIKQNHRQFLKSQKQFTDYDFEASGMDVILDLLAYNTHYNGFYINYAINETFLRSADSRRNVVRHAESFNYTPKSMTAATTYVDIEIVVPESTLINAFGGSNYGIVQLGQHTRFTTTLDGTQYTFVNTEPVTLTQIDSETFTAERVEIRQGIPNTFRYVVDSSDDYQLFRIPNQNVDTSTLRVSSQSPNLATMTNFVFHKELNLQDITGTTPIYFLSENASGEYEVEFGDGVYGYAPVDQEEIFLEYLVTQGPLVNGVASFTGSSNVVLSGNRINNASVSVTNADRAFGGADRETTESVRFNAPKYYQAQDRAVINNDYASIVRSQFSNIESVNVWGGEQNTPPKYGKVFVTVKPYGSLFFTENEKTQIADALLEKMMRPIEPVIVDAKYTYLVIDSLVKFDSKKTLKRSSDLKNEIITRTMAFSQENIEKFQSQYYNSRYTELINETDSAIVSNITNIELKKEFTPPRNIAQSYTFYFQNEIFYPYTGYRGSIRSTTFEYNGYVDCQIEQREDGDLTVISRPSGSVVTTVVQTIGKVDYGNGAIVLNAFAPDDYANGAISLFITPAKEDIQTFREFILRIKEADVAITMRDITSESSLTNTINSQSQGSQVTIDTTSNAF